MRLLHVVPTYFPATRYGGPIKSVHGLCNALVARGHDVHVFTTNVDGPGDSAVPLARAIEIDGVNVWYFPSRWLRRLYWSPSMGRGLASRISGFDVVHLHSVFLWPTWAAARAARRCGVPYVLSPRGMLVKDLIRARNRWIKSAWIALIERSNIEQASGLHLTASLEEQELDRFEFRLPPTRVIPNGVAVRGPALVDDQPASADVCAALEGGPYVLYLGRMSWKKGIETLLRAVASEPRLRVVIAGNDDEAHLPQVRLWIAELGLESRATVLPRFIGDADKLALFNYATVFALPSLSENFGIAALEAMAAGCPVVVTDGVGLAADIGKADAGIVAPPDAFGAALRRFLDEPGLRTRMGDSARRMAAERFGWPRIAAEMESFYASITAGSVRAPVQATS